MPLSSDYYKQGQRDKGTERQSEQKGVIASPAFAGRSILHSVIPDLTRDLIPFI